MRGRSLMIAGLLTAAFAGQAAAQVTVVGSPHDLSAPAGGLDNDEVCVYCHTPHGGNNATGPLWNKLAQGLAYDTYDATTTIDGTILGTLDKVSLACLTCHDGTQAPDVVINAPNSGFDGVGGGDGLTETKLSDKLALTGAPNIGGAGGTDLTNDHPIAIQYGGYNPGTGVIDPDINSANLQSAPGTLGTIWWVETGTTPLVRNKEDLILYTRDNGGDQPFVECGTCHDPHAGDTTLTTEVDFLRISNTGSDLCLACHIK
ncbi:MAG TPA: cytochrome c3 family protein [Thermohalobaculum sp.]|nr:cytochrome c3 family protein [Thermohalobaculum sp.]